MGQGAWDGGYDNMHPLCLSNTEAIPNPDISRVACFHIQSTMAVDVVVYLNAPITQKRDALGSSEG